MRSTSTPRPPRWSPSSGSCRWRSSSLVDRRNERARTLLGTRPDRLPGRGWTLPGAVVAIAAVLGLAAAQPVLSSTTRSPGPRRRGGARRRRHVAVDGRVDDGGVRRAPRPRAGDRASGSGPRSPDVPTGLGTFTDRPLPLLLPTTDRDAFAAAVHESLGIERPPGLQSSTTISSFDAVAPFPLEGYFRPRSEEAAARDPHRRGEHGLQRAPASARASRRSRGRPSSSSASAGPGERVFGPSGQPESAYIPPPATGETLHNFLAATHGHAYGEDDVAGAEHGRRQGARLRADREPRLDIRQTRPGALARRGGRRPAGDRPAPPEPLGIDRLA